MQVNQIMSSAPADRSPDTTSGLPEIPSGYPDQGLTLKFVQANSSLARANTNFYNF